MCALVLVEACAARKALDDYPRAVIDRPFTLPHGVDSWSVGTTGAHGRDDFGSKTEIRALANWRLSLSDDWNLDLPNPGLLVQLLRTPDQWLGASLAAGLGAGSQGFLVAPRLGVSHHIRIRRDLAWSSALSGEFSHWTDESDWAFRASAAAGPLWQITQAFALQPVAAVALGRTHLLVPGLPLDRTSRVTVPLGMNATWSASRQWDVTLAVGYDGIGYENGYRQLEADIRAVQFW